MLLLWQLLDHVILFTLHKQVYYRFFFWI